MPNPLANNSQSPEDADQPPCRPDYRAPFARGNNATACCGGGCGQFSSYIEPDGTKGPPTKYAFRRVPEQVTVNVELNSYQFTLPQSVQDAIVAEYGWPVGEFEFEFLDVAGGMAASVPMVADAGWAAAVSNCDDAQVPPSFAAAPQYYQNVVTSPTKCERSKAAEADTSQQPTSVVIAERTEHNDGGTASINLIDLRGPVSQSTQFISHTWTSVANFERFMGTPECFVNNVGCEGYSPDRALASLDLVCDVLDKPDFASSRTVIQDLPWETTGQIAFDAGLAGIVCTIGAATDLVYSPESGALAPVYSAYRSAFQSTGGNFGYLTPQDAIALTNGGPHPDFCPTGVEYLYERYVSDYVVGSWTPGVQSHSFLNFTVGLSESYDESCPNDFYEATSTQPNLQDIIAAKPLKGSVSLGVTFRDATLSALLSSSIPWVRVIAQHFIDTRPAEGYGPNWAVGLSLYREPVLPGNHGFVPDFVEVQPTRDASPPTPATANAETIYVYNKRRCNCQTSTTGGWLWSFGDVDISDPSLGDCYISKSSYSLPAMDPGPQTPCQELDVFAPAPYPLKYRYGGKFKLTFFSIASNEVTATVAG